jgi:hypothetical protein
MSRRPRFFWSALLLVATSIGGVASCGRTGMLGDGQDLESDESSNGGTPGSADHSTTDPDLHPTPIPPPDDPGPGGATGGPECIPTGEICNGEDDDCDGETDEVPAVPCPDGGFRYCVSGSMSECPRRCEVCMPGSERVCFISYCTYWGVQTCASDGRSFSHCSERSAPWVCEDVVDTHQLSPELEQCCLDNGYCCLDRFDLDKDGITEEMLGNCEDIQCE